MIKQFDMTYKSNFIKDFKKDVVYQALAGIYNRIKNLKIGNGRGQKLESISYFDIWDSDGQRRGFLN